MTRRNANHITMRQAGRAGMTLSEWASHEAAEDALDRREAMGLGWVLVYALAGLLICSVAAIVLWLPYVPA